jgi:hypothetical protein
VESIKQTKRERKKKANLDAYWRHNKKNQPIMDENDLEEACIEEQGNMSMVSLSLSLSLSLSK